jgi:hypothetical protein
MPPLYIDVQRDLLLTYHQLQLLFPPSAAKADRQSSAFISDRFELEATITLSAVSVRVSFMLHPATALWRRWDCYWEG